MSACETRSFCEPSEFAAAIRGADCDLTILGRGRFNAGITAIDLGTLRIQRLSENLPLILHSTDLGERFKFMFHTNPGPSFFRDGVEITSNCIVRTGTPQSHFQRISGPFGWGSISLRAEDLPSETALGIDLTPPDTEQIIIPRASALVVLQRLHAAAASLVTEAPELIGNPGVAHGMEQTLLQALVSCLGSNDIHEQTPTQHRHQKIMQRFHAVLKANAAKPLYVLEIATAVGASLRSLSVCCQEQLGMGPKKYLLLRRMHLARRALFVAKPSESTVTDIATRFGFWQFGRFAGRYKYLFGESPSVTLRRSRPS